MVGSSTRVRFVVRNVNHQTALTNRYPLYGSRSATPPCEETVVQTHAPHHAVHSGYSSMLSNRNPVDPGLPIVCNICIFDIDIKIGRSCFEVRLSAG